MNLKVIQGLLLEKGKGGSSTRTEFICMSVDKNYFDQFSTN